MDIARRLPGYLERMATSVTPTREPRQPKRPRVQGELTPRQRDILRCIARRMLTDSLPTVREIGAHFGIASPNGVTCHLTALEKKGYIEDRGGEARSFRLIGAAVRLEYTDDEAGRRLREALEGGHDAG